MLLETKHTSAECKEILEDGIGEDSSKPVQTVANEYASAVTSEQVVEATSTENKVLRNSPTDDMVVGDAISHGDVEANTPFQMPMPGSASAVTSEQGVEITGAVNHVTCSPTHMAESVVDCILVEDVSMYEEVETHNQEPKSAVASENAVNVATVNHVSSSPVHITESVTNMGKTHVDVGTQTDPLSGSPPIFDAVITPRTKRKFADQDHAYCKKKLELEPKRTRDRDVKVEAEQDIDSSDDEWEAEIEEAGTDYDSDSDEDWVPEDEEVDSDDENLITCEKSEANWLHEEEELCKESKSIVFDSQLKHLFQRCQKCGLRIKFASLKQRGSLICVTSSCEGGHTENWFSQPFTKGVATGNLLCSGGILYTGNHFASTSAFMSSCKIRFFGKGNFNSLQRKYLWPVVNHRYLMQQRELLQSLRGERLVLAGDGRCDSPGHNAKYGTYSIMHVPTEKILHFSLVQVSEVANSNCMEKEGLKRCLENLERDGQAIDILATDR